MAIYRGSGGAGDATTDAYASQVASYAQTATTKANEASASATAADLSATDAAFEASQAATSATNAATSASAAEAAKTQVETYLSTFSTSFFQQATEPTGDSVSLGDIWFNTDTSDLYVYREVSSSTFEWVAIILNDISNDSDIIDSGAF